MRILTLNLYARHADWPRRRRPLAAALRSIAPDIVLFQECVADGRTDQAAELLGANFQIFRQSRRAPDGGGLAVASRWRLSAPVELDLRAGDFPAGSLAVDVQWPDSDVPLLVVNHKPSWRAEEEDLRRAQTAALLRYLDAALDVTGQSAIIGGDLDAEPDAPSVRLLRNRFRDLWREHNGDHPGPTFAPSLDPLIDDGRLGDRRIDYLFAHDGPNGPALEVRLCERVFTTPVDDVWISDHFGLIADLTPTPAETAEPPA